MIGARGEERSGVDHACVKRPPRDATVSNVGMRGLGWAPNPQVSTWSIPMSSRMTGSTSSAWTGGGIGGPNLLHIRAVDRRNRDDGPTAS